MKKSHVATMLLVGVSSLGAVVYGSGPAQGIPQQKTEINATTGKLTLLRVNESGVHHVTVKLQSDERAFTFGLNGASREAMLDLLREAFVHNLTVEISSIKYPNSSTNTVNQVSLKR